MRCACAMPRSRRAFPSWCAPIRRRSRWVRRPPAPSGRSATPGRCCRSDNAFADEDVLDFVASVRRFLGLAGRRADSSSPPSPRSTACRCRCATSAAGWSRRRPAATARPARTSPPTSAPSSEIPQRLPKDAPRRRRGARRGLYAPRRFPGAQRAHGGERPGLRQSAQHGRRLPAPARPGGDDARGR